MNERKREIETEIKILFSLTDLKLPFVFVVFVAPCPRLSAPVSVSVLVSLSFCLFASVSLPIFLPVTAAVTVISVSVSGSVSGSVPRLHLYQTD